VLPELNKPKTLAETQRADFGTLKAAGLVDTLKGPGPFTVFAPTDAAFAKLPPGTVQELLKPANKGRLTAILTCHVVPGEVRAADVVRVGGVTTVNGASLRITTSGMTVKVNNAKVTSANIDASNGVIHVVDKVPLPPKS
jgi:uncharacterized surface protein with fasciclin (FAS1) repeats